MADDWDADDFDPTANLNEKLVELDLSDKTREKDEKTKKDDESLNNKLLKNKVTASKSSDRELTEKEKLEMVKKSDLSMAKELLGLDSDEEEGLSFEKLKSLTDFEEYADKLAEKFKCQINNKKQYEHFVAYLVKKLVEPLDSFTYTNVEIAIKSALKGVASTHEKVKEETKPLPSSQAAKKKKNLNKKVFDDLVDDEYDEFAFKYEG